jgi:hypothetical protein
MRRGKKLKIGIYGNETSISAREEEEEEEEEEED